MCFCKKRFYSKKLNKSTKSIKKLSAYWTRTAAEYTVHDKSKAINNLHTVEMSVC